MVDVIEVFGSNFIVVDPEGPGPGLGSPGDPESPEGPQSPVDPRGSGESMADLPQRVYTYGYAGLNMINWGRFLLRKALNLVLQL